MEALGSTKTPRQPHSWLKQSGFGPTVFKHKKVICQSVTIDIWRWHHVKKNAGLNRKTSSRLCILLIKHPLCFHYTASMLSTCSQNFVLTLVTVYIAFWVPFPHSSRTRCKAMRCRHNDALTGLRSMPVLGTHSQPSFRLTRAGISEFRIGTEINSLIYYPVALLFHKFNTVFVSCLVLHICHFKTSIRW